RIHPDALAALQAYAWPGNVRELENVMERTLLFAEGDEIRLADLPENIRALVEAPAPSAGAAAAAVTPVAGAAAAPTPPPIPPTLPADASMKEIVKGATAAIEKDLIVRALEETGGNVTQSAKKLKISRKSLQNKMKEFGLRDSED